MKASLRPNLKVETADTLTIGWNEWCGLPELGIPAIKAKIDTGARTSALHAWDIQPMLEQGVSKVMFKVHPLQADQTLTQVCSANVVAQRLIMSSNGHKENRYIIATPLVLGPLCFAIELSLSNRDPLAFRMLLGRQAMHHRVSIDPGHALLQGKLSKKALKALYGCFAK